MAKIEKTKKGYKIVHEVNGLTLGRARTLGSARRIARKIRARNR